MNDQEAALVEPVSVSAPAKLNLYLHVTGRRDDGYHELDSLVAFADIHDTIEVRHADNLSLTVEGPFGAALSAEADNLVLRAARALAEAGGIEPAAQITLTKTLPVAAGIGGGSADAAATLNALSRLWSLNVPADDLAALALTLGADVPVCLERKSAFVGGIGEALTPAPILPAASLVLVNPLTQLSTPAVFAARTGEFSAPARFDEIPFDTASLAGLLGDRRNDLTDAAISLAPEVGAVLQALDDAPGTLLARMSGSGATCFGLYKDAAAAKRAAKLVRAKHPGWWVAAGKLLSARAGV